MASGNFWTVGDLQQYLALYRKVRETERKKVHRVRARLKSGHYMTDDIARATAEKMIQSFRRDGPA